MVGTSDLTLFFLINFLCTCRFKWTLCKDCVEERAQIDQTEEHFVAIESDNRVAIYSISKAFDVLHFACYAVVAKDLLKGLLHDRGKGTVHFCFGKQN